MAAVREAHVDGNVLLAPVSANDLAHHTPPPWDPVVLAHPHLHAHKAFFFCAHRFCSEEAFRRRSRGEDVRRFDMKRRPLRNENPPTLVARSVNVEVIAALL